MKSITIALLIAGISTSAFAESVFGPKTTQQLASLLTSDGAFYVTENLNSMIYMAVVRCNNPEGTINKNDKITCNAETIEQANTQRDLDAGKLVSLNLYNALSKNDSFYGGIHQGWVTYAATVTCYIATSQTQAGKATCEAEAIETQAIEAE